LWLGFSASVSGFEIKVPDALLAKLRGQELMKKQRAVPYLINSLSFIYNMVFTMKT
jgi:hypothetical protein